MLLPLLLIGVVAFLAGQASKSAAPRVGTLGPGAPAGPHFTMHLGERVHFELGRPYRIIASSSVTPRELPKLTRWLRQGTYHVQHIAVRQLGAGATELCLGFVAPKTEVVPIGAPLDWDLGDGKLRLVLRSVQALDARPLVIGTKRQSPKMRELRARARAELVLSRARGRPVGDVYSRAMQHAIDLERRGLARPSELPALFDELRAEVNGLPVELLSH